ncbi:MAG: sigma-54 dependent transcriptional regulator [candidate division Zixibacteria bacterium]|nr:sigma-54 dependent transcriptional regulator [candidate division Zixibacteria bacterium]MDH3936358.1 sigma-54 dependent transcriptional regulator [candidate division Zixibacteria bacterium]MDH4033583.1 sigma-54 dependent transcriptional regulator [candidate division Zixibacteria bacterium]
MKNILLVDDDKDLSQSLANLFDPEKFNFSFLEDGTEVCRFVDEHEDIDLVMLDVNLPSLSGLEVLKQIKESKENLPIIVISGFVSTDDAMEAMREGAFEYLTKPFQIEKLIDTVNKACGFSTAQKNPFATGPAREEPIVPGVDEIVGQSPEIVEIAKLIGQVAKSDAAVLIIGESGTGKELVAHAVHRNSKRHSNAFLSVNCAALPETLLESELFGHEKGAFTGAYFKRIGKFEQTDGGTLFLDEIADMTMLTQSKLLRVLQDKNFQRVGGTESLNADVRIVAATNKSLVQCMKEGSFRVDLFYRLKVVSIYIPPLRERRVDIPLLVSFFCKKFAGQLNQPVRRVSKKALQMLTKYQWPGNVRELENNIQNALVMSKSEVLQAEDFPVFSEDSSKLQVDLSSLKDDYTETFTKLIDPIMPKLIVNSPGQIFHFLEAAFERAVIASCLKHFDGNQVKTSETLGISRNTLRDRISRYDIY